MRDNPFDYDAYYDDYEKGGFIKSPKKHHKSKNKKKGHQSRKSEGEMWADMAQWSASPNWDTASKSANTLSNTDKKTSKTSTMTTNAANSTPKHSTEFIPGPNSHTIKGVVIDYDRVLNMEKAENEFNGKITYGIKFLFKGNRGSSRTIWYNDKLKWRDSDFDKEYIYWVNVRDN